MYFFVFLDDGLLILHIALFKVKKYISNRI